MKNRLFALLLIVALVITVSVFAVGAEETEVNPFEGQTGEITAHCEHCGESVKWAPIPTNVTGVIQGWSSYTSGIRHFYLTADSTCGSGSSLDDGVEICINLNGFAYTRTNFSTFFTVNDGTLNIMDSSLAGTGRLVTPHYNTAESDPYKSSNSIIVLNNAKAVVNQYGGTLYHVLDVDYGANGGSVSVKAGTYNLYDGTLTGNTIWTGGAVSVTGGTFNMKGGTVTGSTTSASGGGGFYVNAATLNVTGGTITGCSAPNGVGGAIGISNGATVNLNGGKLYNNTAKTHPYIYSDGEETAKNTLNIGGTVVLGGDTVESAACRGMAVYANDNTVINMSGGTIQNLTTTSNGAAFAANSKSVSITMTGGLIQNCTASYGGAIHLNVAAATTISGGEIKNCTATTAGGAIAVDNANAPQITISGSAKITGCTAPEGGAIYLGSSSASTKLTMSGGTIDGCTATVAAGNQLGGGAIKAIKGTVDLTGGTIQNCSATSHGGAVLNTGATVNLNGTTIDRCSATQGGAYYGSGSGAKLNFSAGEIKNCSAGDGGAMWIQYQSAASGNIISGTAKITNCSATNAGGAIRINGSGAPGVTMTGGTISGCKATTTGGAVHLGSTENGLFKMTGGRIEGDGKTSNSTKEGGAVYVSGSNTFELDGGTIYKVKSNGFGGAVYAKGASGSLANVIIKSGTIDGTLTESNNYGGVDMEAYSNFEMSGGTIQNVDDIWTGGALSFNGANGPVTAKITGGTVQDCFCTRSASNGAGVYMKGNVTFTAENLTIKNCISKGSGANLFIDSTTTPAPRFTNCTITGGNTQQATGSSGYGANVYVAASATFDSCTITDGRGWNSGANIFVNGATTEVTITGNSLIRGGQATAANPPASRGGNITLNQGTLNISGNTVVDGAGGTTAYYMGKNINVYGAGATLNLTGNTEIKGKFTDARNDSIAIDPGCFVTVDGNVKAEGIYLRKTEADGTMTVKEGFAGEVFVVLETPDLKAAITPGATIGGWLTQDPGYNNGGTVKVLDSSMSSKPLADTGDGFKVAMFGGFVEAEDENGETIYVEQAIADLSNSSQFEYVKSYLPNSQEYTVELTADTYIDINNSVIHFVTGDNMLYVIDNRTDAGVVAAYTKFTVDNEENLARYAKNDANGYQYLIVGDNETGYTSNRVQVTLDKLSIKTTQAGIYYTTTMKTNANIAPYIVTYGTAASIVEMPTADFVNQESVLYTEYVVDDTKLDENGNLYLTTRSALIADIVKEGAEDNATRSATPIFASSFIIINLGEGDIYIMADETFDLSLNDAMERLDAKYDTLSDAQKEVADNFYAKWLAEGAFVGAELPNLAA